MQEIIRVVWLLGLLSLTWTDAMADPGDSTRTGRWYTPDFLPLQFAGNIGFLSTGLGYTSSNNNYQLLLLYGYVPRALAKASIHKVTVKNNFPLGSHSLRNNQTLIPYLGAGLTVEVGGNAFFRMPDHFPENYYAFPKNLHVIAYGGARVQHLFPEEGFLRGLEFFAEAGTVDAYLWYKTISSEIRFNKIFSLAIGVNFLLD